MTILDKIIANKRREVALLKEQFSIADFEKRPLFSAQPISLKQRFIESSVPGIIAEFKRQSPSKGIINDRVSVQDVTQGYAKAGAFALSVLTDEQFFGGRLEDLVNARAVNKIPILRKDFMIDEIQIAEAKSVGADVILLIAANLTISECNTLAMYAKSLGLNILLEIHDDSELPYINENIDMVGVNNRNLKTFEVSIQNSLSLADKIPNQFIKISESGLSKPEDIHALWQAGFKGFLMGENFMKTSNPGEACQQFIQQII